MEYENYQILKDKCMQVFGIKEIDRQLWAGTYLPSVSCYYTQQLVTGNFSFYLYVHIYIMRVVVCHR